MYPVAKYRDKYITPHVKSLLTLYEKIEARWNGTWDMTLGKRKAEEKSASKATSSQI